MNIIKFIISRRTFVSMLFIGLTLLGYISYKQLQIELFPNAELPFLIVQVQGAQETDPEYLENQAIIPLEGTIGTLEGIDKIESYAEPRQGMIFVYYNQNVELKYAYLRLQEKVDEIKPSLPEEFFVNVLKVDTEQLSNQFMGVQVRGSGGVNRIRNIVDQEIVKEFENIDGIANVEVSGGRQKSVEIIMDEDAARAYNITPAQVRTLIIQNSQTRTFVGQVYGKNKKYFVNVAAEYTDVHDLENIVVRREGPVLLKDVAEVFVGVKEESSISRVNGKEAVTVQLVRDTRVNLIDLSHTTRPVIERLNDDLKSKGIEIVIQSDVAEDMEKNVNLIIQLAIIGGLLAVIILWLFLRNIRLVLIITFAIPISVFTALNFFYLFDITLNIFTLLGMAIAIGMLLDNSVVVLENIYRLKGQKKNEESAVVQGTGEVLRSIFAATLTTITVFLPFIYSSNFIVKLFGRNIGVSIISTLLVSLAVALLLVPMVTHYFLQRSQKTDDAKFQIVSQKNRLLQVYTLLLKSALRFPARAIIMTVVIFFASVFICLALSLNVSQEVESEEFNLYITMPQGATLESTDAAVKELESRLDNIEEKGDLISKIYEGEAILTVKLVEDFEDIKNRSVAQVKNAIEERIDDFRIAEVGFEQPQSSRRFRGGGGANPGAGLERMLGIGSQTEKVVIKGRDFDRMRNVVDDMQYYLDNLSSVQWVRTNISDNRPEIHLHLDTKLMSQYDVSLNTVAAELNTFQNEFSSGLTYKQGTEEYDIIIRGEDSDQQRSIDDLKQLTVPGNGGGMFELQQLGRTIFSSGMAGIHRVNQEKQIEVTYKFIDEVNDSKSLLEASRGEVEQVVSSMVIPAGIAVEVVHDEMELDEFYFLIGAAFILIYMILASVFESLSTPVVMMFTIPLAAMGSFWALILTGNSLFNANTLMGFLILLGLVVNNGVILIDYTRILRKRGFRRSRALMVAGQARARPILITAITTIIAMTPLAMGKAEYVTQIGAPFAITVIGGLSLSTLFTLIFIPTVYSGLETALNWIRGLDWKIKVIQFVLFIIGFWAVYFHVDSLVWKLLYLFVLILLVPGMTYFIMTSLRQAEAEYIKSDEPITIRIQNLMKIYDWDMRFVREWKRGKQTQEKMESQRKKGTRQDIENLIWQLPLMGFLIYFVYFYIQSSFWLFILSHIVYFYGFYLWKTINPLLENRIPRVGKQINTKLSQWIYSTFFWGFPLFNLILFYFRWDNITMVLFIAFIWYLALTIYTTSNRLHQQKVNVNRLTGKFAGVRRQFYRFVQMIPVIGKKKTSFKALDGVSLEIGRGMFGLLGPNGAGKTTLMRIVCGILEQSYGKVWINNIDASEKREELQGLIGYLPQEFGTYENMTAYEFLNYQAILKNILDKNQREKMVQYVLSSVHMEEYSDQKIGSFSGGMKQRIGIAQILLHLPRILVVDEPTAGLDPRERIRFRNLLVELSRERVVIFSTHIIEDISSSCSKVAVLNKGKLRYIGEPQNMTKTAEGVAWQFYVPAKDFEKIRKEFLVVHHMREGEKIRVRCLAESQPVEDARSVRPTLEDAYLWLLKKRSNGD